MAKHFSFIATNVNPISQNNRSLELLGRLKDELIEANNHKPGNRHLPFDNLIQNNLEAKVFYIHRVPDYKDADNISKPLWDSLNQIAYVDDKQIKYLETLKIHENTDDIIEFDISEMDDHEINIFVDFFSSSNSNIDRILYISLSEYESKKVRFI